MFERKNIDPRVQKQLFRKIDSINRLELKTNRTTGEENTNEPFFVGNALDVSTKNPASQHLFRSCFAKVSVAVPNPELSKGAKKASDIVQQPISISSYMNEDVESNTFNPEDRKKNTPLTFLQGLEEKAKNRFRGHSGITKIAVTQLKYYTYKYTIDWTCPDPVYFEDVFEPNFLKLGAFVAIEFGWGIDDSEIKDVEPLTIKEMQRFLTPNEESPELGGGNALYERNLRTSGNYFCGVGTVMKFDWKIGSDGTYTGNIEVITPGTSALSETTQGTSSSTDSQAVLKFNNTFEIKRLSEKILQNESKYDLTDEDKRNLRKAQRSSTEISNKLKISAATFNVAMKNLDKVADYYLDDKFSSKKTSSSPLGYNDGVDVFSLPGTILNKGRGKVIYDYHEGLLRLSVPRETSINEFTLQTVYKVPDYLKKRYFMSWGWFEDNMLNTFFELKSGSQVIQTFKSETKIIDSFVGNNPRYETFDNKCVSGRHLYSLGLDYTILPRKHHPILNQGFSKITDPIIRELIPRYYTKEQRVDLDRIRMIDKVIDENFPSFIAADRRKLNYGNIRNMVFPIEMFQKHFENTTSTRQGIRNFWADVNNQYGGYWGFQIGESVTEKGKIGVFDSYYSPKKYNSKTKPSSVDVKEGMFTFSVYSKDSIVKTFDVSLDLSAEAATIARYGHFTKAQSGTTKIDGKKDLGVEAWNILNRSIDEEEVARLEELQRFRDLNDKGKTYKNVSYSGEDLQTSFLEKIKNLTEDDKKVFETIENQRVQFIGGVGAYDKKGNFSSYFKSVMLHLINFSDMENTDSNIEVSQPILPVSISLTLDGIGGINVGNLFKVDYLPKIYREFCYFMVTKVEHNVGVAGWETSLEGVMIADLPTFWKESGRKLNSGLDDYQKLFELTNVESDVDRLTALSQEREINFSEEEDFETAREKFTEYLAKTETNLSNGKIDRLQKFVGIPAIRRKLRNFYYDYHGSLIKYRDLLTILERDENVPTLQTELEQLTRRVESILNEYDDSVLPPAGGGGSGGAG